MAPEAQQYAALVELVRTGDLEGKRLYAQIALAELIRANRFEIERARQLNPEYRAQAQWEIGAQAYVLDLEQIAAAIPTAGRLEVIYEAYGVVRLSIDQAQVILSTPRLSQQSVLDHSILEAACEVVVCPESPTSLATAIAVQAREIRHEWSFSDQDPPMLSASDGLRCVFADNQHLQLKEIACDALMQELRLTAEGLRALVQHGGWINWRAFKIVQLENGHGQQVIFDSTGTSFDLALPQLGTLESVWRGAIPWLQARLRGYRATYLIKVLARVAYSEP